MKLLVGTSQGLFAVEGSGGPAPVEDLAGRSVRQVVRSDGALFAGADNGIYRSRDGGRSWQMRGAEGKTIWDITPAPNDPRTLYAGTQPAALYRSHDGGDSWTEIESLLKAPGAEQWCVPVVPPQGGRARTVVVDAADPHRCWVGIEVGGVVASDDGGQSWTVTLPGGNPDIHVMTGHPARPGVLFATTGYGRIDNSEPMEQRIAGLFRSDDSGKSWRYLWGDLQPRYTRPMCIDARAPHALTVACAPTAFSSHRDPNGAEAMLYQSEDAGETWRSLGDADHAPSKANFLAVGLDPEHSGSVLVGTDTGEVWRVSPNAAWALLASGLPAVQAVHALS